MRKITVVISLMGCFLFSKAQLSVHYDSSLQDQSQMQYYKPMGNNLFAGDCIPFSKDGVYYLYWLIDSAHHSALHGLGGHQWVLSTSADLKHWVHHPVVIGIDEDWEKSICTGSVVYYKNIFYAFYATRLIENGKVNEQLSYATSTDGIHFQKQKPNPFYTSAPGYSKRNFRDPKVIVDADGVFHLFIASNEDSSTIKGLDGCLVHLVSKDLKTWTVKEPILNGQASTPECPDYFYRNGWYYLVYSDNSNTSYLKSKNPFGPWEQPHNQALNEDWSNVVKTAEFSSGRRIAASWIPNRFEAKDNNREIFGGNVLLREVNQSADGTLYTSFPKELIPRTGKPLSLEIIKDATTHALDNANISINAPDGLGASHFNTVPLNCRITMEIEPKGNNEEYGLYLRSSEKGSDGYKLSFAADAGTVRLGNTIISAVEGLHKNITVDIIMKGSIIDVCVDGKRCIVNRVYEQNGNVLWLFAKHGLVSFKSITISPLLSE